MRPIDADAVIKDTWFVVIKGENIDDIAERIIRQCKKIVSDAPTIDAVEVVHGEWIHNPKIGWGETWVCSICGEKTTSSVMGKPRYKYCPLCGAKMKGADDE